MSKTNPLIFLSYLDEFSEVLQLQMEESTEKYGDQYLTLPRKGQTQRIFHRLIAYFWEWILRRKPVPWLKVAGYAFIAWLRETQPYLSEAWTEPDEWDDSIPTTLVPLETGRLFMVGGKAPDVDPKKVAKYIPPQIGLGEVGLEAKGTVE